jgi:adenine-specific DNA methylase
MALLLPDPCDVNCPPDFKSQARGLLPRVGCGKGESDDAMRQGLLKFIGEFANWDLCAQPAYLEVARGLVRAAYPDEAPLVADPFSGGGSIPLEALRLGCDAFASDLNPVACLILKVMLEDIPRHGPGLGDALRAAGAEIKGRAETELAGVYPPDLDGARPIAYLWSRTVRCEAPDCGAEIPLMRSRWLSRKANRRRALRPVVVRARGATPRVDFEIFEPSAEAEVEKGTVTRAKASCLCCLVTLGPDRVRAQLAAQHGGADTEFDAAGNRIGGARLLAVVTRKTGEVGQNYRLPTARDYEAAHRAQERLGGVLSVWEQAGRTGLCPVPDEPTPVGGGSGAGRAFSVQRYGMLRWGDLFTARQKVALCFLVEACGRDSVGSLRAALACALSRVSMSAMSCTRWNATAEKMQHTFGRQALPMVWDFAEVVVTADAPGNWKSGFELVADVVEASRSANGGEVQLADATQHPLTDGSVAVWFTDPPYYDAIPYADLADFFFVWLKRVMPEHALLRDPFDPTNRLTPKTREAVQDETKLSQDRPKDRVWFEETMAKAFGEGRRVLREDGIGSVVFAHKTTEGWEALLSGIIRGGWTVTGSWPIATEMATRLRARESAALATSVHLVCRPRTSGETGEWSSILRELPRRVAYWMERLQAEHVRGADLVFACIGPALEIFSRYSKVETAEGREVPLADYLSKVWEVVGRAALEQVLGGSTGALEEDARLTALFLWTLQSSNGIHSETADADDEGEEDDEEDAPVKKKAGGYSLVFDVARRFAQPLGIHLPEWEGRIIETDKGMVRLLPIAERARQLFGETGTRTAAAAFERDPVGAPQLVLFPDEPAAVPKVKARGRKAASPTGATQIAASAPREATTLDRVHAAMLLQRSGQSNALRALLGAEQDRGPDFLRLANALSALYPRESDEKRLLDAMLLAVPR